SCERVIENELRGRNVKYHGLAKLSPPGPLDTWEERQSYRELLASEIESACQLRIPAPDINTADDVFIFREAILALLRDVYKEDDIYICLAGGRKSMSGIAAIAAQLYGGNVRGLYHLYILPDLEDDGDIGVLEDSPNKERVLCPGPSEVRLVNLAFFQFVVSGGHAQLALRGQMQEYVLDYLAEHEELATVLEPATWGQVLGYVFEAQVAAVLDQANYWTIPHYRFDDGDIDVWAIRKGTAETDVYARYENGLAALVERIGNGAVQSGVSVYQHRLKENIFRSRRHGDTETRRAERAEIIDHLNQLTTSQLAISFNELCGPEEIVVCECKFFEDSTNSLPVAKVRQAVKYRMAYQRAHPHSKVQAWVITNAAMAEDGAWRLAEEQGVQLMTTGDLTSSAVRALKSGRRIALLREKWIQGPIRPMECA
ncbi:MAG: hypothetical protein JXM73_09175, partial [Anaerolineae bacterium]|nr:hypothetical protein [Anaerolineae bacterium]